MSIDKIAYTLRTKAPVLFSAIELLSRSITHLRHGRARLRTITKATIHGTVGSAPMTIRQLGPPDTEALHQFLSSMPEEHTRYFRPHDFSHDGVTKVLSSGTYCCYGISDQDHLIAYCLIKLFPTANAYCGLAVSNDMVGIGLGKFLWRYLIWQCVLMGVNPCATAHVDNLASLGSLKSIKPDTQQSPLPNDYLQLTIPTDEDDAVTPVLNL